MGKPIPYLLTSASMLPSDRPARRADETTLQRELLAALPSKLPHVRLYRRMVGVAEVRGTKVRFGIAGQCDLHGFTHAGRAVEVELKSASGTLSAEQKAWRNSLQGWGVAWFCLQAVAGESHAETIDRWCAELGRGIGARDVGAA